MGNRTTCFVCEKPASVHDVHKPGTILWFVDCGICGRYGVPLSVQEDIEHDPRAAALLPYLSAYIRQHTLKGEEISIGYDWPDLARSHASTPVAQKLRRLLELVGERTVTIGQSFRLDEDEIAPLIDAKGRVEVRYLLQHLQASKYVDLMLTSIDVRDRAPNGPETRVDVRMEVAGWEAVSPVAAAGLQGRCFVAMSFDPSLEDAYENGIVAAVEKDCGFEVVRIDRVQHNDDITDRILAGIRTAQFVVADFTKQRPGVYFEAGFAAGLGRTVIWTCHSDDFDGLHFDTRQRNHIKWTAPSDLRQKLADRIRATVTLPARFKG